MSNVQAIPESPSWECRSPEAGLHRNALNHETEVSSVYVFNHIPEMVSHKIRCNQISEIIRADEIIILMIVLLAEYS